MRASNSCIFEMVLGRVWQQRKRRACSCQSGAAGASARTTARRQGPGTWLQLLKLATHTTAGKAAGRARRRLCGGAAAPSL